MPPTQRPFLTARWTDLLLLNFPVPAGLIAEFAPPGTEPDLFASQAFVSVVGFQFRDTCIRGWRLLRHSDFLEINLRSYVRRHAGDEIRRGVVFVQEIVPWRHVALVANGVYHEHYVCRAMRSARRTSGPQLAPGDEISYGWRTGRKRHLTSLPGSGWNTLAARVAESPAYPHPGSLTEFIVEHYWGYSIGRDGRTREYQVVHVPWRVATADHVVWECDGAGNSDARLAPYLACVPASAYIADGASVQVFPGRKL